MTYADWITAQLIRLYQRWISPYKGFRCAYGVLHGGDSCSQFAMRTIELKGFSALLSALPRRFAECRLASERIRSRLRAGRRHSRTSAGDCALDGVARGADGCLQLGCDVFPAADCGDAVDCCSIDF